MVVGRWFRVLNETMVIRAHAGTEFDSRSRVFREPLEGYAVSLVPSTLVHGTDVKLPQNLVECRYRSQVPDCSIDRSDRVSVTASPVSSVYCIVECSDACWVCFQL